LIVQLAFSEDVEELRKTVRRFLVDKSPEVEVRRLMDTAEGYDRAVWKQMSEQLELQGLVIPEEFGGQGFSPIELIAVTEEMGRALLCAPYFSSVVMAANLLLASGDRSAQGDYLPGIADGSKLATVALAEPTGRWDAESVRLEATGSGSDWRLTGEKLYVIDGTIAELMLIVARSPAGVSIFAVDAGADGLEVTALPTMDQTRKLARVTLASTPARLLGTDGEGWPAVARMLDLSVAALAAEQVGGAQCVLDTAVEYAKDRMQFGRAIGSFQAIKHKCADMLVEVESARSAAYCAGWVAAEDPDELAVAAAIAKSFCSEAFFHAAAANIQIHGGIGFTWEHSAHLYFKRAKSSELLFGDPVYHRERLAQRIGV
jgi:alkylation response protein AidB-like acyl-CoA dehydrogenase